MIVAPFFSSESRVATRCVVFVSNKRRPPPSRVKAKRRHLHQSMLHVSFLIAQFSNLLYYRKNIVRGSRAMMKISQAQMDALAAAMDEDRWLAAISRSQRGASWDSLLAQASEQTLKRFSRELGIYQTEDLMRLFELVIKYGIRFYQLPWAEHFFHKVPFDYPHETLLHLLAQSQEYERERSGH